MTRFTTNITIRIAYTVGHWISCISSFDKGDVAVSEANQMELDSCKSATISTFTDLVITYCHIPFKQSVHWVFTAPVKESPRPSTAGSLVP